MRINKYVAQATGLSRRAADSAIAEGRVLVNNMPASAGQDVTQNDQITLNGHLLNIPEQTTTTVLNKPTGYVVSRDGQGSPTIYDLLPTEMRALKPVGRLDKDSSGLLLLTNDGGLAHELTHPSRQKRKVYQVSLSKELQPLHRQMISEQGISLDDGVSRLGLERQSDDNDTRWVVSMHEGRNRQIRRTFAALGYNVTTLHRTIFGEYQLNGLPTGELKKIN